MSSLDRQGRYQIVAVPSSSSSSSHDDETPSTRGGGDGPASRWETCEDFEGYVRVRLSQTQPNLNATVSVDQVTRLVDGGGEDEEPMGDCFLVGLLFEPGGDNGDDEGDEGEGEELLALFGDVTAWLDPKAEAWVTCSDAIPLAPPYGWGLHDFAFGSENSAGICACLRKNGLAVVQHGPVNQCDEVTAARGGATANFTATIIARIQDHVQLLEDTVRRKHPHIALGESAFGFLEYTHRGPQRFEVLFAPTSDLYCSIQTSLEDQWIQTVRQYLEVESNDDLRLNISCVYSRPGAPDQDWHTDGDHCIDQGRVHAVRDEEDCSGGIDRHRAYAVCIFVPLVPLTEATGCTRFWPKSHTYPNLLGLARAADGCLQATVDGSGLRPGDFLLYDYTTWHRGMANQPGSQTERPILQFLYSWEWYHERKNYGTRSVFE